MSGLLGNWGSNIEQGLLSALPVLAENDPYKIGQQLLREGAGVGGIAWHGSPHKFTRPDLSKIGTGEGAQAYGHGFYSAEAKGVGEEYRTAGSLLRPVQGLPTHVEYAGRKASELDDPIAKEALDLYNLLRPWESDPRKAADMIFDTAEDGSKELMAGKWLADNADKVSIQDSTHLYKLNIPDETIGKMLDWDKPLFQQSDQVKQILDNTSDPDSIQKKIDALQSSLQKFDGDDDLLGLFTGTVKTPPVNQKIYKEIERLTNEKLQAENLRNRLAEFRKRDRDTRAYRQGSLKGKDFYNHLVGDNILPKKLTQRFNNRDEAVEFFKAEKQRFKDAPMSLGKGTYEPVAKLDGDDFTVETYDQFGKTHGQQAASEYLNSLGIPGIKYLDGNSRAAGQGSRNFVSFTPDHIEMLERNGVPMKGLLGE